MGNIASVINGEVSKPTASSNSTSNNSSLNKDAFLQLLVTQMKYQDPLEPTDNTEYVSQLATFSELEEMQNISAGSDLSRATSLVGQYVTINSTGTTGESTLIGGKVDYVVVENNKAYLNINGTNYSIDDLDSVVDQEYLNAYNLAGEFTKSVRQLPTINNLTVDYKDIIENLSSVYNDMTSYQKQFVSENDVTSLRQYENRLKELLLAQE